MGRWDLRIYDTLLCTQRYSLVQLRRYLCKCRQSALLLQDFEPLVYRSTVFRRTWDQTLTG